MKKFEEGFLLGAATAAHQTEGNNIHSDYWLMENMKYTEFSEKSGLAVDHYNRYKEDIDILKNAGLNAYRFSIEWARIEPEEGVFDEKEVEHYRDVLSYIHEKCITPVVTLMHFTSPSWLIKKGGWRSENTPFYFQRYVSYVIEKLGDLIPYVVTLNEANMGVQVNSIALRYRKMMEKKASNLEGNVQVGMNFNSMMENMKAKAGEYVTLFGTPDPKTFVSGRSEEEEDVVISSHIAAREAIKRIRPEIKVGLSLSLHDIQSLEGGEENASEEWRKEFSIYLDAIKDDDFLGIQNYARSIYGKDGLENPPEGSELTQMGYENYPYALGNGIATDDDEKRRVFIGKALEGLRDAKDEGVEVKGYFHWSLLDNFEWQKGFAMTFGLIAVDRSNMERHPKESLYYLGSFAPEEKV